MAEKLRSKPNHGFEELLQYTPILYDGKLNIFGFWTSQIKQPTMWISSLGSVVELIHMNHIQGADMNQTVTPEGVGMTVRDVWWDVLSKIWHFPTEHGFTFLFFQCLHFCLIWHALFSDRVVYMQTLKCFSFSPSLALKHFHWIIFLHKIWHLRDLLSISLKHKTK